MSKKSGIPVAILIRVSTSKQETRRQLNELTDYATAKRYRVVEVCSEVISGEAADDERVALKRIIVLAQSGKIQKVLVHEISRIARRNSAAHKFVEDLTKYGVSLYWHSQGIETLLPDGKRNPAASIMLAVLAELARAENETLKARIASGLAEARRKGKTLGRPKGPGKWLTIHRRKHGSDVRPQFADLKRSDRTYFENRSRDEFLQKHHTVVKLLRSKQSIRNAAKIAGKGISTVQRVKAALAA